MCKIIVWITYNKQFNILLIVDMIKNDNIWIYVPSCLREEKISDWYDVILVKDWSKLKTLDLCTKKITTKMIVKLMIIFIDVVLFNDNNQTNKTIINIYLNIKLQL